MESLDNSSYENADHIHDMNSPIPEELCGKFDTIIDGGCLEHIFNVAQAFDNCSRLCRPGGQIIHILPANNFCGHGFWQFSPELFFSLYSEENGYRDTEVYLADLADRDAWYRVHAPTDGERVNVLSSRELYVMVRTVLAGEQFSHRQVQQSDYVYTWESEQESLLGPTTRPGRHRPPARQDRAGQAAAGPRLPSPSEPPVAAPVEPAQSGADPCEG